MSKKNSFSFPVVGVTSLMVIYAVLSLTIFSLLSLNTALADKRLAQSSIDSVASYYEADTEAERIYALIRKGEIPEEVYEADGIYYYTCAITENRYIEVEVTKEEDGWKVLKWRTVTEAPWEEQLLDLWDGEFLA